MTRIHTWMLMKKGGAWLGAVRKWIQWSCINGSYVTWGSDDVVNTSHLRTVKDLEEFGAHIAEAVYNDFRENSVKLYRIHRFFNEYYDFLTETVVPDGTPIKQGEHFRQPGNPNSYTPNKELAEEIAKKIDGKVKTFYLVADQFEPA